MTEGAAPVVGSSEHTRQGDVFTSVVKHKHQFSVPPSARAPVSPGLEDDHKDNDDGDSHESDRDTEDQRFSPLTLSKRKLTASPRVRVRKGSLDNTTLAHLHSNSNSLGDLMRRSLAQLDLAGEDEPQPQPPSSSSSPLSPTTRRKPRFLASLGQLSILDPKEEEIHAKRQLQRQRRRREVGAATGLSQSAHDEPPTTLSGTAATNASLSMSLSEMSTRHANLEGVSQRRSSDHPEPTHSASPSVRRPTSRRSRALSPRPPPPSDETSPQQEPLRSSSPRNRQTTRRARGLARPPSPTPPEKRSPSPWNRPNLLSSTTLSRALPPEEEEEEQQQQQLRSPSPRNRQTKRSSRARSPLPPPPLELEGQPMRSPTARNQARRRSLRALSPPPPPTVFDKTSYKPTVLNSSDHEGRLPSPRQIPRRRASSLSKQQTQPERSIQHDSMHMSESRIDSSMSNIVGNSSTTLAAPISPKAQRHRRRASMRAAPVGTEHTPNTTADVSPHHASDSRLNHHGGSDVASSSHSSTPRHGHRRRASMQASVMDKVGSILNLSSRSRTSVSPKRSTSSRRSSRRSSPHASHSTTTDLEHSQGKLSTSNSSLDISDGSNSDVMSSAVLPWKANNSSLDIAIDHPHSTVMSSSVLPWKPLNRRRVKSLVVDYHSSGVSNSAITTNDSQRGSRTFNWGVGSRRRRASMDLGHSSSTRSSAIMDSTANHSSLSSLDPSFLLEDLQPQVDISLPVGALILGDDDKKNDDVDTSERTPSSKSKSGSARSSGTHGGHRRRRTSVSGGHSSMINVATNHSSHPSLDPSVKNSVLTKESNLTEDNKLDKSWSGRSQPSKNKSGSRRSSSTPREHRRRRHSMSYGQAPEDSVNNSSLISLDPASFDELHHPNPEAGANKERSSRQQQDGSAALPALADTIHTVSGRSSSESRGEPSSSSSNRRRPSSRSRRRGSSKGQQGPKDNHMAMNNSSVHSLDPLSLLEGLEDSSSRHFHTVLHASAGTVSERRGEPSSSSHHRQHRQLSNSPNISVVSNDTWLHHSVHTLDTLPSLPPEFSNSHSNHRPRKHLRRASVDGATLIAPRSSPPTPQGHRHQRRNSAYASIQARTDGGGTESYPATGEASADSPHSPATINATDFLDPATSLKQWLDSGKSPSPRQAIKVTKHQPQQHQKTGGGAAGRLHASSSALPIDPRLSPNSAVSFNKSFKTNLTQSTISTLPLCDDEVDDKDEEDADGKENTTENGKKEVMAPLVSRKEGNKNKKSGNEVATPTNRLVSQSRSEESNVEFDPVSWGSDVVAEPEPEVAEGRKPRESRLRAKFRKLSGFF